MKKLLIVLAVLGSALAAGLFAVTQLISVDNIQEQVVEKVREATGRELTFDRPRLSFFPSVGLRLRNVTLSNPGGKNAGQAPMITLKEVNLQLALQPLFHHQVEVTNFTLQKPVIHLRREKDGSTNWVFSKMKKAADAAAINGQSGGGQSGGQPDASSGGEGKTTARSAVRDIKNSGLGFKFGQMQIADGIVTFDDAAKGTSLSLEGVNVTLTWPDFASNLGLDGEFNYKSRRVNFVLNLARPLDFLSGQPSDGDLQIKTKGFSTKAKGDLSSQGTLLQGAIDAHIDSLSDLTAWLEVSKRGLPFEKLSFESNATLSAAALKLTGAKLELDDIKAGGDAAVTLSGRPDITAQLNVSHLDLDRFSGQKAEGDAKDASGTPPASKPAPSKAADATDWDDTPLKFDGLRSGDANLTLKTEGFSVKGAEVGPGTLTLLLQDGALKFTSSEASMFEGTASFSLDVNVSAQTPRLAFQAKLAGVQAKPLLTAFAHFSKLSGAAFATIDVTSEGASQKELVGKLAGHGTFDFKNGSLEGVDLMKIVKLIQARLAQMDMGGQTQFVDMAGTFTITKGIWHNDDLKMTGPLLQTTGAGDIDLPGKYVNYRALPKLTASAEEGAKGLTVPVDIKGPFSSVKAKPDYKGMVAGLLGVPNGDDAQDAAKAQGQKILKGIQKNPGKLLQGLFGGSSGDQ